MQTALRALLLILLTGAIAGMYLLFAPETPRDLATIPFGIL